MKEMYRKSRVGLVCLQETKLSQFEWKEGKEVWGRKNWEWVLKEAINLSSGILIAWDKDLIKVEEKWMDEFSISKKCKNANDSF